MPRHEKIRALLSIEKIRKREIFSQWRGEFLACLATEHRLHKGCFVSRKLRANKFRSGNKIHVFKDFTDRTAYLMK